ncbi:hypothetical protein NPIL_450051 [Nephila pilipes]|uniref:SWI/SNF-related matrix-associated actin-dependent regulator of chromatin subfamily A containing DEAD/H box 1 homolog n=1 Tax=Nephila pilipes TaxID=299642 RepID=A0A8X6QVF2_NEPPI|nr:hypothetical protein NPIL_450051 [Nephila pilipes]
MPDSCESDGSSSSLISSLRSYRFQSKSVRYTPPVIKSPSVDNQNSVNKDSGPQVPDSTSSKTTSNGSLPRNSINNQLNSSVTSSTSEHAAPIYSPLSYRRYEATASSQFLLPCIITKFQQALKQGNRTATELDLKLTNEELQKIKELILQTSNIAEKWKRFVPHESLCIDSPEEKTPVNQQKVRTYSRGPKKQLSDVALSLATPANNINDQPDLNQLENKSIMDDYEVFCGKEENLRNFLDAFPGADIMEAQDVLVRCNWDLSKAITLARQQPLRCGKKRSSSATTSVTMNESVSSQNKGHVSNSENNNLSTSSVAEEIVLDSSDEEIIKPKPNLLRKSENGPPIKRARRRISSSDEDTPSQAMTVKSSVPIPKQSCSVSQKPTQPNSVIINPIESNSTNEKHFNVSQSVSIKPVPASSASSSSINDKDLPKNVAMPNLPKGLVITQVGNAYTAKELVTNSKPVELNSNEADNSPIIAKQVEKANIPPGTSVLISNHSKSAQLVRIKSTNNGANANESVSFTPKNNSLSVTPVGKEVSITPVSKGKKASIDSQETSKPKKALKAKRKKYRLDDEDDDDYGNELFFDSEDSDFEEENLTSAHSAVLKFFQESSMEEMLGVPGCSKKKVEIIMNLRPFSNWADLVGKLSNDKYLSTDLLNGAKKVLDMRSVINKLMTKCQQISFDMEDLVENLKSNKERNSGYVNKQPDLLNDRMHLTSYQMLGLNWLLLMHNQDVNGILADEMGLGKTVQAIAFLAYLKEISMAGPHLIVVPSSVMDNWKQEFKAWWPDVQMICYHGNQDNRRELRLQILNDEIDEFDVMITTYNMVTSSSEDRGFFKRLEFHYVVFDEAHMLKNMASQRYQHLMKIKAPRRLLLTGTPLQNNLVELMSLLIFAMPHMFSGKTEHIKLMFSSVSKAEGNKNTYEKDRIDHAKQIMKPFVLRRLKKDVLQDLPAKTDETRLCPMTEDQAMKYASLVKTFSAEFDTKQEKDKEKEKDSPSSGAGMMMQLRRAANHSLLLRRYYDDDKLLKMSKAILKEPTHSESDPNLVFEDMSVMSDFELHKLCKLYKSLKSYVLSDEKVLNSGKFNVLDSLLPTLIEEGHRILLFSQFTMVLDIVEEYMNIKKYKFLRLDGQVPVSERQQLIDQFNSDSSIFIFLLSTRAGGLGINLTAADTVILHDIDFNPYNDKQAEDRCHRVGQVKDVTVIRLISENTIEEGILQRAKEKLKLERDIHDHDETEENDSASVAKLLRDALGLSTKIGAKS